MLTTERRRLSSDAAHFAVRSAVDATKAPIFFGYAAKFNERTAIGNPLTWGFYEEIAPGAFTKTLAEGDARMLVDHDTQLIVARVSAGSLRLAQDTTGLTTDADLDPELSYVRDLTANLRNGNITGMSFGFEVLQEDWTDIDTGLELDGNPVEAELRVIREVRLYEVSAVTFPAYTTTEASLRSVAHALTRRGDDEATAAHIIAKPELESYIEVGEPGRSTRRNALKPAESTSPVVIDLAPRARALAARFGLSL